MWKWVFSPKTELVKLNTALWLPIFDVRRQHRLDMSKYVWKTPHTIYFCIYFLNFWVHFTYVHYDQPKMVDLPNITHAINSWQFLQGKKTAYWMYFGLYIRWKFRKHYGKHSGHGSVHLWHHSGILFFCSFYEVLKHANQSTNFCLTTLESWNFLIKREVLVIDICGKPCHSNFVYYIGRWVFRSDVDRRNICPSYDFGRCFAFVTPTFSLVEGLGPLWFTA